MQKKYYTVQDKETLKLLIEHIKEFEYLSYDTETTSLNPRKGKVIGFSISGAPNIGFYFPTLIWNPTLQVLEETEINGSKGHNIAQRVMQMLIGKKLIMHNASFDTRFTKNFYGIDLLPSLYADTALLVHTVKEEGAFGFGQPFSLKAIGMMVQKELGEDIEARANQEQIALKESIKRNGGTTTKDSFEIWKADLNILSEYAAADADLTLKIFWYFYKQLVAEDLVDFFFNTEVMPVYKEVTISMEEKGIALDIPLMENTRSEIEQDMLKYKKLVIDELLGKDKVRKWIIDCATEEYPPSNKGTFAQALVKYYNLDLPKSSKTDKYILNKAIISGLADDVKIKPFLLTGDTSFLDKQEIAKISLKLWKEDNEDGEYFNIQSKDQMGKIAFNVLGITPLSKTAKGKFQFDDDMVEEISKKYTWAENLRIYNRFLKIKSTYIDRFLDSAEDGRFYPYFKQNGTVSGRYGSDLQQLPKPKEEGEASEIITYYTNLVRAFFISDPGCVFIDTDYQSLEPRIFASITEDEGMWEIFKKGWDFYSTVAIKTEKLVGISPDPKDPNYLKKLDPVKRNKAKSYSLGLAYGMGAYALAMTLGVPQKEGEKLEQGYLDGFPGLRRWRDSSREFVKANGFIKNKVGRIRHLPTVKEVYNEMGDKLMDWRVRKELAYEFGKDAVTSLYRDYRNGLNNALNFQIQSYAASIVNRSALWINRKFKEQKISGMVVAQIHDQLICLVREEDAKKACPIVQDCMENTITLLGVKLEAEPSIAKNLKDGHT